GAHRPRSETGRRARGRRDPHENLLRLRQRGAGRRDQGAPSPYRGGAELALGHPLLKVPDMKVRFGVMVSGGALLPHRRDLDKLGELIRIIDGSGVEMIGTFDTSFIAGDACVRTALIAQTARNAKVGIHPTNPLTREPQIMAAFLASIDAMT